MSYGFDRYCSTWQWRIIFVLDVIIKSSLIYLSAAITTLGLIFLAGFEPIVPIVLIGISISGLHFLCLFFAIRLVERCGLDRVESHRTKFLLLLVFAYILFSVTLTLVLSLGGSMVSSSIVSMEVAATNLIPVVLVVLVAKIANVLVRRR